jgi:hypothetical protein
VHAFQFICPLLFTASVCRFTYTSLLQYQRLTNGDELSSVIAMTAATPHHRRNAGTNPDHPPLPKGKRSCKHNVVSSTANQSGTTLRFNLVLVINRKRSLENRPRRARRRISRSSTRRRIRAQRTWRTQLATLRFSQLSLFPSAPLTLQADLTFVFPILFLFVFCFFVRDCSSINPAYRKLVKYNLAMAREALKHAYAVERLQPPTSLGAIPGTYGTLRARALGSGIGARSCTVGSKPVWACTP